METFNARSAIDDWLKSIEGDNICHWADKLDTSQPYVSPLSAVLSSLDTEISSATTTSDESGDSQFQSKSSDAADATRLHSVTATNNDSPPQSIRHVVTIDQTEFKRIHADHVALLKARHNSPRRHAAHSVFLCSGIFAPPMMPNVAAQLSAFNLSPRLWHIAAIETLLLLTEMSEESASALVDGQNVRRTILQHLNVAAAEMAQLVAAIRFPLSRTPTRRREWISMAPFLDYRIAMISAARPDDFTDATAFANWIERQLAVVVAALTYHMFNHQLTNIATHKGTMRSRDKMTNKLCALSINIRALVLQSVDTFVSKSAALIEKLRLYANDIFVTSLERDGKREKRRSGLMSIRWGLPPAKAAAEVVDEGNDDRFMRFPMQMTHSFFVVIIAALTTTNDRVAALSPPLDMTCTVVEAEATAPTPSVPFVMRIIHPEYPTIMAAVSSFIEFFKLPPLFVSFCIVDVCIDLIHHQETMMDCPAMQTAALCGSGNELGDALKLMRHELAVIDNALPSLDIQVEQILKAAMTLDATAAASAVAAVDTDDHLLRSFYERSLHLMGATLTRCLTEYSGAASIVVRSVCVMWSNLYTLRSLHRSKSRSARVRARDDLSRKLIERNAQIEYAKITAKNNENASEEWSNIIQETHNAMARQADVYASALAEIHSRPLQCALAVYAALLRHDLTESIGQHETVNFTLSEPITAFDKLISAHVVSAPELDAFRLSANDFLQRNMKLFINEQVDRVHQRIRSAVTDDTFELTADGCTHSLIQTFDALFALIDAVFDAAQTALTPPLIAETVNELICNVNGAIAMFVALSERSCADDDADHNTPSPINSAAMTVTSSLVKAIHRIINRAHATQTTQTLLKQSANNVAALSTSKQSTASLAVRLSNVTVARRLLQQMSERMRNRIASNHWTFDIGSRPLHTADDALSESANVILSLIACRLVYVDWHTPLMTILYTPVPSAPAVAVKESGLAQLIDESMTDTFALVKDDFFSQCCHLTYRHLMSAMEWNLTTKQRKQHLMDAGVMTPQCLLVLDSDLRLLHDLFGNELSEETMSAIDAAYSNVVSRLRHRNQSQGKAT